MPSPQIGECSRTSCDENPVDRELLRHARLREEHRRVYDLAQPNLWPSNEVTHGLQQLVLVRNERVIIDVARGKEEEPLRDLRRSENHAA